jgi:hypothetical protein
MTVILAPRWLTDPAPYSMRQTDAKLPMFDPMRALNFIFGKELKLFRKILLDGKFVRQQIEASGPKDWRLFISYKRMFDKIFQLIRKFGDELFGGCFHSIIHDYLPKFRWFFTTI